MRELHIVDRLVFEDLETQLVTVGAVGGHGSVRGLLGPDEHTTAVVVVDTLRDMGYSLGKNFFVTDRRGTGHVEAKDADTGDAINLEPSPLAPFEIRSLFEHIVDRRPLAVGLYGVTRGGQTVFVNFIYREDYPDVRVIPKSVAQSPGVPPSVELYEPPIASVFPENNDVAPPVDTGKISRDSQFVVGGYIPAYHPEKAWTDRKELQETRATLHRLRKKWFGLYSAVYPQKIQQLERQMHKLEYAELARSADQDEREAWAEVERLLKPLSPTN